MQALVIISEPGLYRLVLRSDKPQAKPFQKWVAGTVLPSIRKTGSYALPGPANDEDLLARALLIANSGNAANRLDDDEKGIHSADTLGGRQDMVIISEPGLYSLILTSRKPAARRFKRWVTADVLPAIRKTDSYAAAPASDDDLLAKIRQSLPSMMGTRRS